MKVAIESILVVLCILMLFSALLINGIVMLISPRAWFRMPSWIRLSGGLAERKYGIGFGAIQVRLLGAVTVTTVFYLLHEIFFRSPR